MKTKKTIKTQFDSNFIYDFFDLSRRILSIFTMMVEEAYGGSDDEDNSNSQLTELKGKFSNFKVFTFSPLKKTFTLMLELSLDTTQR